MAKKYLAPDFDVVSYNISEEITLEIGNGMDGDQYMSWKE